jgi:hypothetical protein
MRKIRRHYDHSSAISTNRTRREGKYTSNPHTIITPDFTAVTPNSPPFRAFNHYSCITSLGKLTLQKLIHKLSTLYLTKPVAMGGSIVRNEPATTALLEHYPAAYEIFRQAGWLNYFHRLQGYNEQQVLQFARNLQEDYSVVEGVRISVTEEDIAEVSGLPMNDTRMFSRKHIIGTVQQNFFLPEERIELKGRGVQLSSLPPPWPEVARFIKHYLTCEGRYQVVYQHDFLLLSHLRHHRWFNIPYYLLGCLKNMAHYCRKAKDPTLSLTHHRLVQLLIHRGFSQQNRPLNNPPVNPEPAAEIPEIPEEQQPQNPPDFPEVPHSPPTQPTSPPTIPEQPHTAPESSTPALHILSDDSEPETVAYPIIQERPPRKRKQIAPFPPFLHKKRARASMRPPFKTTTLDTPPIRLTPRPPPIFSISGSLPIPTSVAETQEPAIAETQATATAETQEPAADIAIELQEPDAQTPFISNKVAETQPATHPINARLLSRVTSVGFRGIL